MIGARRPTDRGQAAVEFALAVPLVVVLVLGVVQVLVVATHQVTLEHLARVGARAASVAADPPAAARAEIDRASGRSAMAGDVDVTTSVTGEVVTVTVRYVDDTAVPVVGRAVGDVELSARVTMAREPP